jgi:hypothetical protein
MNKQVSASKRDFKKNINAYVSLVQQGTNVVVRCTGTSFMLSPIEEEISDSMMEVIEQALKDHNDGKSIPYTKDYFTNKLNELHAEI